jgi:hypothetical protein
MHQASPLAEAACGRIRAKPETGGGMKRWIPTTLLMAWSVPLWAGPFSTGDYELGKALVSQNCAACHIKQFGGDGSLVYTRSDRKIRSAGQLAEQISRCNQMAKSGLSKQEEAHVGTFLNKSYYKFSQ